MQKYVHIHKIKYIRTYIHKTDYPVANQFCMKKIFSNKMFNAARKYILNFFNTSNYN